MGDSMVVVISSQTTLRSYAESDCQWLFISLRLMRLLASRYNIHTDPSFQLSAALEAST
jgi:hypothetical protein